MEEREEEGEEGGALSVNSSLIGVAQRQGSLERSLSTKVILIHPLLGEHN